MAYEIKQNMGAQQWAAIVFLGILWGGTFFFNAVGLREVPVLTMAWSRVVIAAIALFIALKVTGQGMPTDWRRWSALGVVGLLNNVAPFTLMVWAQSHITSGLTAILNATTPLWTVLVCHFLTTDEKLTVNRGLGVLIGFVGVVFLIGPQALVHVGSDVLAQLAAVLGAVFFAFGGMWSRRFRPLGIGPMQAATGQMASASILMAPFVLFIDQPWALPMPGLTTWGAMIGSGVLCTALAFVIYFRILANYGATNILLVTFLNPICTIFLGTLILGEVVRWEHLAAMAMIGVGLAVLDGRPVRALRRALRGARA
jgi:drug/metabolite transporter (DMT)-like permease